MFWTFYKIKLIFYLAQSQIFLMSLDMHNRKSHVLCVIVNVPPPMIYLLPDHETQPLII